MINLALKLLAINTALLSWVQLYDIDRSWKENVDLSLRSNGVAQPLYYAAWVGAAEVVEHILAQTVNINAQGGSYGNALQATSARGHEKVVEMLLDAGADVNTQGGEYLRQCTTSGISA